MLLLDQVLQGPQEKGACPPLNRGKPKMGEIRISYDEGDNESAAIYHDSVDDDLFYFFPVQLHG